MSLHRTTTFAALLIVLAGCGNNTDQPAITQTARAAETTPPSAATPRAASPLIPASAPKPVLHFEAILSARDLTEVFAFNDTLKRDREEVAAYLRTQAVLLKTDDFLREVVQSDIVSQTKWFRQTPGHVPALSDALEITPVEGTNLLTLTLNLPDRKEEAAILNAVLQACAARSDTEFQIERAASLQTFRAAAAAAENSLNKARQELVDYRDLHEMLPFPAFHDELARLFIKRKAELESSLVERALQKSRVDQMASDAQDPQAKLPSMLNYTLSADPQLQALTQTKKDLEKERATLLQKVSKDHGTVREVDTKIEAAGKQYDETRAAVIERIKTEQLQSATEQLESMESRISEMKKRIDEREVELRHITNALLKYRELEHAVVQARNHRDATRAVLLRQEAIWNTARPRLEIRQKAVAPAPDETPR